MHKSQRRRRGYKRFLEAGSSGVGHSGIELEHVSSDDDDELDDGDERDDDGTMSPEEDENKDDRAADGSTFAGVGSPSDDDDGAPDHPPDFGQSRNWLVRWAMPLFSDSGGGAGEDEDDHPDDIEWVRSGERDMWFLVIGGSVFVAVTIIVLVYLEYG